ncbi:TetR/AcrR family transcriptional regulator [Nocardia shimofusensis]|uniref:TetR/AcrR family transcriptional regulator n=1 Tax=Nocardia shimofusensis TaxID=228596 RepID=UPI00082E2B98|nr:TetR/AcrR family transcriptional regulator [Nocardia shimofusensis]
MPRPRVHDPDVVLDAAEALAARSGPSAVTVRAVATATGMSNGALYHTFGSRAGLLGRAWLRGAHRFLELQRELADTAGSDPVEAIVAAAEAPSVFAERFPASARLVLTVSRDELLGAELPAELAAQIAATERQLVDLLIGLAVRRWGRRDRRAVEVLTTCLVDLPTALLLRRDRWADPLARRQLRAAVRAVLSIPPPAVTSADITPSERENL